MQIAPQLPDRPVNDMFLRMGPPAELLQATAERLGSLPPVRVNAHIHLPPNFSAFDSVEEAVRLAAEQKIDVLGTSNYYDYHVYREFADRASKQRIFPLFGIETIALLDGLATDGIKLNDPGNPGKMYLCGKGIHRFDPLAPEASALLEVVRAKDAARMARMTARLTELFRAAGLETGLNEEAVKDQIVRRHGSPKETVYLQERHVAQAFQEAVFERVPSGERAAFLAGLFGAASKSPEDAATVQGEIRSHLMKAGKPGFVEETFVDFNHAYQLVLALGGIPCYPTLADGASPICPFETPVEKLIEEIKARGIYFAELIPVRNSPEVLTHYVTSMRKAGLVITAGTEHNTRDMLPIEPTCVNGQPIPPVVGEVFREGACVAAAHQYLGFRGEPGYVDSEGRLNSGFSGSEERIQAFRSLGEAAIAKYRESC